MQIVNLSDSFNGGKAKAKPKAKRTASKKKTTVAKKPRAKISRKRGGEITQQDVPYNNPKSQLRSLTGEARIVMNVPKYGRMAENALMNLRAYRNARQLNLPRDDENLGDDLNPTEGVEDAEYVPEEGIANGIDLTPTGYTGSYSTMADLLSRPPPLPTSAVSNAVSNTAENVAENVGEQIGEDVLGDIGFGKRRKRKSSVKKVTKKTTRKPSAKKPKAKRAKSRKGAGFLTWLEDATQLVMPEIYYPLRSLTHNFGKDNNSYVITKAQNTPASTAVNVGMIGASRKRKMSERQKEILNRIVNKRIDKRNLSNFTPFDVPKPWGVIGGARNDEPKAKTVRNLQLDEAKKIERDTKKRFEQELKGYTDDWRQQLYDTNGILNVSADEKKTDRYRDKVKAISEKIGENKRQLLLRMNTAIAKFSANTYKHGYDWLKEQRPNWHGYESFNTDNDQGDYLRNEDIIPSQRVTTDGARVERITLNPMRQPRSMNGPNTINVNGDDIPLPDFLEGLGKKKKRTRSSSVKKRASSSTKKRASSTKKRASSTKKRASSKKKTTKRK